MRKAAVNLAIATRAGVDFYLQLPVSEFLELQREVADQWHKKR